DLPAALGAVVGLRQAAVPVRGRDEGIAAVGLQRQAALAGQLDAAASSMGLVADAKVQQAQGGTGLEQLALQRAVFQALPMSCGRHAWPVLRVCGSGMTTLLVAIQPPRQG